MKDKTKELLYIFVVALDAAPGATYWGQIQELAARSPEFSPLTLASLIAGAPQFQALYKPASTVAGSASMDKEFSDALITRVLGSAPVSDASRSQALAAGIAIMAEAEKAGQGEGARRATLINTLAEYLGSIKTDAKQQGYDSTHPYLAVALQLANKVLVADYFTNALSIRDTDISVLQGALSRVNDKSAVLGVDGTVNPAVAKTLIKGFDDETQLKIYQAFIVALDAAPGGYWHVLKALVETEGQSPAHITSTITGTPQFQALYKPASTVAGSASMDKEFSDALITRVLGSAPVSDASRSQALAAGIAIMAEAEKAGQGEGARRATLINTLAEYLASIKTDAKQQGYDSTHPYLAVARQLANKVLVAEYVTETRNSTEISVEILQQVLARTTSESDVSTVENRAVLAGFMAPTVFAITNQGSIDASFNNFMFTVSPIISSYEYTIRGFGAGDRIAGPVGLTPTISDQNSFTDGAVTVQFAKDGNVVKLRLTGLTAVQDGAIFRVEDLNTVFGAGSFGSSEGVVPVLPTPVTPNPGARISQAITGQGSFNAALSDVTFGISAISSSYSYTIAGFGVGDRIVGPTGESATLADQSSFTDGKVTIQYAKGGNVVKVTLTGLTEAQDSAIFKVGDLNQVFGVDSFG